MTNIKAFNAPSNVYPFDFQTSMNSVQDLLKDNSEFRMKILQKLKSFLTYVTLFEKEVAYKEDAVDHTPSIKAIKVERDKVEARLKDFNYKESRAWKEITDRFGSKLSQSELLAIAVIISYCDRLKLDREAKRRKEVLIKWFDENIDRCLLYFESMVLVDEGDNITGAANLRHYITSYNEAENQNDQNDNELKVLE